MLFLGKLFHTGTTGQPLVYNTITYLPTAITSASSSVLSIGDEARDRSGTAPAAGAAGHTVVRIMPLSYGEFEERVSYDAEVPVLDGGDGGLLYRIQHP